MSTHIFASSLMRLSVVPTLVDRLKPETLLEPATVHEFSKRPLSFATARL